MQLGIFRGITFRLFVAIFFLSALCYAPLLAATYTWDTLPGTSAAGDSIITGGSGTWNTALRNWTTNGGASSATWVNGNNEAIFGGTPGTVTLGTNITANALTFNSNGYLLGGTSTLVMSGPNPTISVLQSGDVMTMTMPISGTAGYTLSGNGTLRANHSLNSLTGAITVTSGATYHWTVKTAPPNNFAGTGTVILESNNTGSTEGTISRVRGEPNNFAGKYLIKNGTFHVNFDNIGAATLEAIGHSQILYYGVSGTNSASMTLNSIGYFDPTLGNTGNLRLEGPFTPALTGNITLARDSRITAAGGTAQTIRGTIQEIGGPRALEIGGQLNEGNYLTLSGSTQHTGGTLVSGLTYTTSLYLDYNTSDVSKFDDNGRLAFRGDVRLSLFGATGNHTEVVGEFVNRGGLTIIRGGINSAKIALGNMDNPGSIDVLAMNLATTTTANNALGYLPGVAFNSKSLAANDGAGNIIAAPVTYTTFNNLSTTPQTLPSVPNSLVRLTSVSGSSGVLRPNPSSLELRTDIGSLLHAATEGPVTIDMSTFKILRFADQGEIIATTYKELSITNGIVTAGGPNNNTPGTLRIHGNLTPINIASSIQNNGTGAVTVIAGGNVFLNYTSNFFTGGLTICGTTSILQNGSLGGAGNIVTLDGGTLVLPTSGTVINKDMVVTANGGEIATTLNQSWVDGNISGPGLLTLSGIGNLQVRGLTNSYTGGTMITGMQVIVGTNTSALGTGPITVRGGTSSGGGLTASGGIWTNDFFLSGRTSGTNGALNLDSTIVQGTITLESDAGLSANHTSGTSRIEGNISGPFGITKLGTARLTLTGTNTFNGPTKIANGILAIGGASSLTNGDYQEDIIFTGGTLAYESSTNQTLRGTISGSGALSKAGTSTLTLTGTNTYLGDTTITAGKLLINGNSSNTGNDFLVNGGTLGGTGTIAGTITVVTGATLSPGASIESLATGTLTMNPNSIFEYEFNSASFAGDLLRVSGNLVINNTILDLNDLAGNSTFLPIGTKLTLVNYTGTLFGNFKDLPNGGILYAGSNNWQINYAATSGGSNFASEQTFLRSVTLTTTAIPEPSTMVIVITLCGTAVLGRRRFRKAR